MTPEQLIDLAKRKNAAHAALVRKRSRAWGVGATDAARKVQMDADSATEQEAYDNLSDEYDIAMMFAQRQ